MFRFRFSDRPLDPEPVPHQGNAAEGDAGLGHAPGSGIHAEQEHALGRIAEPLEILPERRFGVAQWVVDMGHGSVETETVDLAAQVVVLIDDHRARPALLVHRGVEGVEIGMADPALLGTCRRHRRMRRGGWQFIKILANGIGILNA